MSTNTGEEKSRLRLLYDLGCAFAARTEIEKLVPYVVERCREVLDAEGASVQLYDPETNELHFPYVAVEDSEVGARLVGLRFPADRGVAGAVLQNGRPVRVDDVRTDPRFYSGVDRRTGATTRNMVVAPLTSQRGRIGVIQVINRRGDAPFTDDDLAFLDALAGSIAVAIENARLYAELKASEERLHAQVGALRRDLARPDRFPEFVGTGPVMAEVFQLMESAAASPIAVLIEGETGTGKELAARMIHRAGARADNPFLAVNCAALPETLLENELFGHSRGAFTGAAQDHKGLFEAASGGTVFLDEIGEMPLAMQAKLLRVLQEGEITRLGDTRPRKVDVRVVSATNRDLAAAVAEGLFRTDLYYRLEAFPVHLPPLRERREDIPLLADRFLAAAAERHRKRVPGIEAAAMDSLMRFEWHGNVRELQNEIERAVALGRDGEPITRGQLSPKLSAGRSAGRPASGTPSLAPTDAGPGAGGSKPAKSPVDSSPAADAESSHGTHAARPAGTLRDARAAFERRYLAEALRHHGGNVSRAARALGLSRVALHRKMKDYGLR
jgi:Nif-specific regulatory protein